MGRNQVDAIRARPIPKPKPESSAHTALTERSAGPLKERQDSCKVSPMDHSATAAAPILGDTTPARGMVIGNTKNPVWCCTHRRAMAWRNRCSVWSMVIVIMGTCIVSSLVTETGPRRISNRACSAASHSCKAVNSVDPALLTHHG